MPCGGDLGLTALSKQLSRMELQRLGEDDPEANDLHSEAVHKNTEALL